MLFTFAVVSLAGSLGCGLARRRVGQEGDDPGAVFDLVARVFGLVVGGAVLPHAPEDLEPPLSEAAERGGVARAPLALLPVVGLGPDAGGAAEVRPEVDGGPQRHVAAAADDHVVAFAGAAGDRGGAGVALQGLGAVERLAVRAELGQQPRGDPVAGAGEGAEQV